MLPLDEYDKMLLKVGCFEQQFLFALVHRKLIYLLTYLARVFVS